MYSSFNSHLNAISGKKGFSKDKLTDKDFNLFKRVIKQHFKKVIKIYLPSETSCPIELYHKISEKINHSEIWEKRNRILKKADQEILYKTDIFKKIKNETGELKISDEDSSGFPEIYFRLVRPYPFIDVGPLHADKWFWDIGNLSSPKGYKRVKFWFSLLNEKKFSGFRYVPSSHRKNYNYQCKIKNGIKKPDFDEKLYDLEIEDFICNPGEFIMFNDNLLHGGSIGYRNTRVSFEFTLFVRDN